MCLNVQLLWVSKLSARQKELSLWHGLKARQQLSRKQSRESRQIKSLLLSFMIIQMLFFIWTKLLARIFQDLLFHGQLEAIKKIQLSQRLSIGY